MKNTILEGFCEVILHLLADKSVNCIVTSPPYWGLRDYGLPPSDWPEISYVPMLGLEPITVPAMDCCLGMEVTPSAFVAHMVHIFRIAREKLADDGTLWLNFGDTYAVGHNVAHSGDALNGRNMDKMSGTRRKRTDGLKYKDMAGIPWRVAFALQADGWYLRQDIIWSKPNPMPESIKDRCTKSHEYVFLLTKSEKYYFDNEAIKEKSVTYGKDSRSDKGNIRYAGKRSVDTVKNGQDSFVTINETRNKRSVWNISTRSDKEAHFATFPPELPALCIKAGCKSGGVVLDIFGGSGTTAETAARMGLDWIIIEPNPSYIKIANKKLNKFKSRLF